MMSGMMRDLRPWISTTPHYGFRPYFVTAFGRIDFAFRLVFTLRFGRILLRVSADFRYGFWLCFITDFG